LASRELAPTRWSTRSRLTDWPSWPEAEGSLAKTRLGTDQTAPDAGWHRFRHVVWRPVGGNWVWPKRSINPEMTINKK